ncbi:MAG TPA: C1 family peptidase [Pyrinomonadaceae bacterium]|jgi:hypothetical protein|nr:C1 family peptidase [Pyrinomonadaceae bacterium]
MPTRKSSSKKSNYPKQTMNVSQKGGGKKGAGGGGGGGGGDGNSAKRILNVLPSQKREKDWSFENATDAGLLAAAGALPQSRDLRAQWWKINDQGTTGSCVGWATADGLLRWHFVQVGRIPKDKLLSPRFIWMAAKETDEFVTQPTTFIEDDGTSLKAALDIARKYGAVFDTLLPFKTGKLYPNPAKTFYAIASQLKVSSYFNLSVDVNKWRTWLATQGPIMTRLSVDSTWDQATSTNGNLDVYHPPGRGGHAVCIVGYTPDRFIVRNSWGKGWGDDGFGYASISYAMNAFTESYGIIV